MYPAARVNPLPNLLLFHRWGRSGWATVSVRPNKSCALGPHYVGAMTVPRRDARDHFLTEILRDPIEDKLATARTFMLRTRLGGALFTRVSAAIERPV